MITKQYQNLIARNNQINEEKVELNRLLDKGKSNVKREGKVINIRGQLDQLDKEQREIIRQLNEFHK